MFAKSLQAIQQLRVRASRNPRDEVSSLQDSFRIASLSSGYKVGSEQPDIRSLFPKTSCSQCNKKSKNQGLRSTVQSVYGRFPTHTWSTRTCATLKRQTKKQSIDLRAYDFHKFISCKSQEPQSLIRPVCTPDRAKSFWSEANAEARSVSQIVETLASPFRGAAS